MLKRGTDGGLCECYMAKKVLVIKDEAPLSRALQLKLAKSGYDVVAARDGQTGFELVTSERFDLILLDLIMPKMDGFEFLTKLKAVKERPRVFVLSNLGQEEDKKRVLDLGAEQYFVKSDTPLFDIVEKAKAAIGT